MRQSWWTKIFVWEFGTRGGQVTADMIITIMPVVPLAIIIFSATHAWSVRLVLSFANEFHSIHISFQHIFWDDGPSDNSDDKVCRVTNWACVYISVK